MRFTCGGIMAPDSDAIPRMIMGTQQKKSVRTMRVMRLAMAWSERISGERTASRVRLATMNIQT